MTWARVLRLAPLLLAAACLGTPAVVTGREAEESGPRLILPGSHAVVAGQEIALAWTRDDEVSELEILLSVDGGRTYPIWISPRLSPRDCRFVWRVPDESGRSLRMRIRFNRGGREIEGAPTASLDVVPAGAPEPLGLPPLSSEPARTPRPGGETGASTHAAATLASRASAAGRTAGRTSPRTATTRSTAPTTRGMGRPCFVPMRA